MILHPASRIQEYTAQGWWGTTTLDQLFRRNVAAKPDAVALVDPLNRATFTDGAPRRTTYAELDAQVDRLAAALLAHGVGKDDIVAVQLPNIAELVIFYLAVARLGAIASPFPVQYREYELEQLGNFAGVKAFVTMTRIGERHDAQAVVNLKGRITSLQAVLAFGDNVPEGVVALDPILAQPHDAAALDAYLSQLHVDPNEVFTVCWTSGTESMPKGVPRTHNDWIAIAYGTTDAAGLTGDDHLLCPFPLVNMAGIGGMHVPWLLTGSRLVMHHPFDLPTFLKQVVVEKITYTVAPPALLNLLLLREEILAQADISSLRIIGSGSAPLSPWMVKTWWERHGIHVTNFFGSNEGIALIGAPRDVPDPEHRARYFPRFGVEGLTWSARVAQGMRTRLVDPASGEEVTQPGRPGELLISGPTVFSGYFKGESLNRSAFDDQGYYRTGDVFEIAGEGDEGRFYRYVDRAKDIINRGGMKIASAELEALLQGHPAVAESAVVGYPDPVLGERTCAFIVAKPGATATFEDIVGFLKDKRIASYKLPERVEVIPSLPRNPVGKILKRELRAQLTGND